MAHVKFITQNGQEVTVDAKTGMTLMEAATRNGVQGIIAECGGACSCSTCHVHVAQDWYGRLPAPSENEAAMLEFTQDFAPNSRLACQIKITPELEGLTVNVANNT
jgi:2Fe-2S ferredoxin